MSNEYVDKGGCYVSEPVDRNCGCYGCAFVTDLGSDSDECLAAPPCSYIGEKYDGFIIWVKKPVV